MARVKRGVTSHARHKKVLKKVKGQYGARSKLFKVGNKLQSKLGSMHTGTDVKRKVNSDHYGS